MLLATVHGHIVAVVDYSTEDLSTEADIRPVTHLVTIRTCEEFDSVDLTVNQSQVLLEDIRQPGESVVSRYDRCCRRLLVDEITRLSIAATDSLY